MPDKKRVLVAVPSLCVGGVTASLLGFLALLPLRDWEVTLLLFSKENALRSAIPEGITVDDAAGGGKLESVRSALSKTLQTPLLRPLFSLAKKCYHRFGSTLLASGSGNAAEYDLAIAYQDGLSTWYMAQRVSAKKKIAFVHTDFTMAQYDAKQESAVYQNFQEICFGSLAARDRFLSLLPAFAARCSIVPNVVDRDAIRKKAEDGNGFTDDFSGLRILTVGRLSHEKGSDKIPGLVKKLDALQISYHWYLIGDGPLAASLKETDSENLVLLGVQSNPYPFLNACDVYVQPSDYEGYCIALAEARALARPIVTCDFAGAREQIVSGESGIITDFSEDALFQGIAAVIESASLRAKFSQALAGETDPSLSQVQAWISAH